MEQGTWVAKGRVNGVSGVDLGRVKGEHFRAALKGLKVPIDDKATDEALTVTATSHFAKNYDRDNLAKCDECHGVAPDVLDACPYCGSVGDAPAETIVTPATKAAQQPTADKETKMQTQTTAAKPLAKTNGASVTPTTPSSTYTQQDLDKAVKEVVVLKAKGAETLWDLGHKIAEIHDKNLWKLRLEDGKQRWKNFDSFCNVELNMTPQNAKRLLDVAVKHSVEEVRKFGPTKLGLLLTAPPEAQEKIKAKIEAGASKRDVEREVQKAKADAGHRRPARGKRSEKQEKALAKASKAKAEKVKKVAKTVTVANMVGRVTVKLYEKPTTKKVDFKTLKRAKTLGDQPYGRNVLANGVVQEFYIQKTPAGELILSINTTRESE